MRDKSVVTVVDNKADRNNSKADEREERDRSD